MSIHEPDIVPDYVMYNMDKVQNDKKLIKPMSTSSHPLSNIELFGVVTFKHNVN